MNPKLPLDGRIYTLTVGRVLNIIVFQINLGLLLFRATLKLRLGSCLSDCSQNGQLGLNKIDAHLEKFTACLREGLIHTQVTVEMPFLQHCSTNGKLCILVKA